MQLAAQLGDIANLTVVTNCIRVAEVLRTRPRPDRTVVLTGGVRTPSDALVGPGRGQALRTLHLDMVFMGVHGMSERAGFTTPNLMEAETNRAFVDADQRLAVLADHTKWGVTGLSTIAPLDDATSSSPTATPRLDDNARRDGAGRVARPAARCSPTGSCRHAEETS